MSESKQSHRRWFRFSLRALLLLIVVVAVLLGLFDWKSKRLTQHDLAVAVIRVLPLFVV